MKKGLLIPAFLCLLLISGSYGISYAATKPVPVMMQKHIDKIKRTKPATYQKMLEKAGGNILNCSSCHQGFGKNSGTLDPKFRR